MLLLDENSKQDADVASKVGIAELVLPLMQRVLPSAVCAESEQRAAHAARVLNECLTNARGYPGD